MAEYVEKQDGAIRRTYMAPEVDNLPLVTIALHSRGSSTAGRQAVIVDFRGGIHVNSERVHPFDLIRFCDAVLEKFTGSDLERARRA